MNLLFGAWQGLVDLVYPPVCLLCAGEQPPFKSGFCGPCSQALFEDLHRACPRCAGVVGEYGNPDGRCAVCRPLTFGFTGAVRLGIYKDVLQQVVLLLKHRRNEILAERLGACWARERLDVFQALDAQCLVPMPLHWSQRLQRGYNQSLALARGLSSVLHLPCHTRLLFRVRATAAQKTLPPAKRLANVRGAFKCQGAVKNSHVLLVDDVMTTGATASEAALALLAAGAGKVTACVLSRPATS